MWAKLVWPCLGVLALLGAAAGRTEAPAKHPSPLGDVPGLERPIAYSEVKVPLGELVAKVARETGVHLTADRAVADEPVAVAVDHMPAARVLDELADLLGYRWVSVQNGNARRYEILQDREARQAEEALRQAAYGEAEQKVTRKLNDLVQVAVMPEDQFLKLRREAQSLRQIPPGEHGRLLQAAGKLQSPIHRVLAQFLGRLSNNDWSTLGTNGRLRFNSQPGNGERELQAEFIRLLKTCKPGEGADEQRRLTETGPGADVMRKRIEHSDALWSAAEGFRVVVHLNRELSGTDAGGAVELSVFVIPVVAHPPGNDASYLSSASYFTVGALPGGGQAQFEGELDALDAPERRDALNADPVLGAERVFRPQLGPVRQAEERPASAGQFPQLLPALHKTFGAQFISDAYWSAPTIKPAALVVKEPQRLYAILDRLVRVHYDWRRKGDLVRFKSRNWFFDRAREIPLRTMRTWEKSFQTYGALPFDQMISTASWLTDAQVENLKDYARGPVFPAGVEDLAMTKAQRYMLRLCGSLPNQQGAELWRGNPIPLRTLTPAQQDLVLSILEEGNLYRAVRLTPEDLANTTLSMQRKALARVRRGEGPGSTLLLESSRVHLPELLKAAAGDPEQKVKQYRVNLAHLVLNCGGLRDQSTFVVADPE